ncbi:MAG: glycosyltransferase family 2 protein [Gemmatimonadetes bacterium]|nr:glycosyltransferase family 2 protein [Gemmatimonadota bacterium]
MTAPVVDVSILICTRNRQHELSQTLAALQRVAPPAGRTAELLLADNGSTDGTAEVARAFRWQHGTVRVVSVPQAGKGHAYNGGLAVAAGSVILLTDDDVRPAPEWISSVCAPIWQGRAEMVAGGVSFPPHLHRPWMTPSLRSFLSSTELLDAANPEWVVGANLAFSRRVLERVPAFDPALGPGGLGFEDEVLFAWQVREAGFRIVGSLEYPVQHWFSPDRLRRSALGRYLRAHGRSKAYVEYHWEHRVVRRPRLAFARALLRWLGFHARHPLAWSRREGISEREADALRAMGYFAQFAVERRRPRQYARRGLVRQDAT